MKETSQPGADDEFHDETLAALKSLRPRSPQLDWEAIRAATVAEPSPSAIVPFPERIPRAVAWWSGVAAGTAITFLAMQWFIVSDLKIKVTQLEQIAGRNPSPSAKTQVANDSDIAVFGSVWDLNAILNGPNLSVGSYRGHPTRWVHARSKSEVAESIAVPRFDEPTPSENENPRGTRDRETDPSEPEKNRVRLLKELQREIY
ncbi:MAG: hypothetical protein ACK6DC_09940 [Planctomycetota bacterium]|jgi:hypothetical protein